MKERINIAEIGKIYNYLRYENFLMQAEQRKKTWTSQHDVKLIQLYL